MFTSHPPPVVLPDYPSVNEDREVAAAGLDRLASLGEIHWCDNGSYPPNLCACPPRLIVREDKVRVVREWSDYQCSLNSVLVNPPGAVWNNGRVPAVAFALQGLQEQLAVSACRTAFYTAWRRRRADDFSLCATKRRVPS